MKGFVPTPNQIVDLMVEKLFENSPPSADSIVLDPGCGQGTFIEGIVRWCVAHSYSLPNVVGIESDVSHFAIASKKFSQIPNVQVKHADFLSSCEGRYDYIVGNPPYVSITELSEVERAAYRGLYVTAQGRFDLYLLFFEQGLRLLKPGGRLVFISPEKYLYVETARPLRRLLRHYHVSELHFLDEDTFSDLVTYPLVSSIVASPGLHTRILGRYGDRRVVSLSERDTSWLPVILGSVEESGTSRLADVCSRISCGVATGADSVFVVRNDRLDPGLRKFARPTLAGRELRVGGAIPKSYSLLVPYTEAGDLIREANLGALSPYLKEESRRKRLLGRTCVQRKPWYAFHETPPMVEVLKPKLLCKDIAAAPFFVVDRDGEVIPRHSVYYIVPRDARCLDALAVYMNSHEARDWLRANCQRAAKGFLRLQSRVLQRLPIPSDLCVTVSMQPEIESRTLSA